MGRMTPAPAEVSGGSTAAAVNQAWRQHDRARAMDCGRAAQQMRERAERWLSNYPEFQARDGRPCSYAIEVAVQIGRRRGPDAVTRAAVRAGWLRWLSDPRHLEYVKDQLPQLREREEQAA